MQTARNFSLRPLFLSATASVIAAAGALFASPAEADDRHGRYGGHGYRGPQGHYSHGHGHNHYNNRSSIRINSWSAPRYVPQPVYYAPAPVYYAPTPAYYAPPYTYYGPSYYPPRRHSSTSFSFTWR